MSDAETLRELFAYDPSTGDLVWKPRALKWFSREQDWKTWNKMNAGKVAGSIHNGHGYRAIKIFCTTLLAHRIIWAMQTGEWPDHELDHIDQDRANNKWINLRKVTSQENKKNQTRRKDNTTGVTGVYCDKRTGKHRACIVHNGRQVYLGTFAKLEDAAAARAAANILYDFSPNHGNEKPASVG